ncbi:MAG TPA: glycosyltransferase, partial [Longimicrobiaceae bacterium]|nr:glycosyltransferase [Longimicrobiaceae bacterium]
MRIALVSEYYYPHLGGISEHVHFFAREMRRRGHHVDVITSRVPGAAEEPGVIRLGRSVRIYANGSVGRLTVGRDLRRKMRDTLRRGRYDVVHVHGPFTSVLGILAIDEAECAVVGTFHTYFDGAWAYNVWRKPLQRRLDRMHAVIAVSPSAAEANASYFDADWRIVPNGVDVDFFHPLA